MALSLFSTRAASSPAKGPSRRGRYVRDAGPADASSQLTPSLQTSGRRLGSPARPRRRQPGTTRSPRPTTRGVDQAVHW